MSTFYAILTEVGEVKIANAHALGETLLITHMAVGDGNGNPTTPDTNQTALVNERRRAPLNELKVDPQNPSAIIAEQVIPESIGGWWIREIGLLDDDGDLVAVANCPDTYKPVLAEGSGRTQVIRMVLVVSSTSAVELKIDPAVVLATRAYVDALTVRASQSEAEAGTENSKVMTPKRVFQALRSSNAFLTAPQFNSSTLAATTKFVRRALGSFADAIVLSADTTLTAEHVGVSIHITGGQPVTLTLPEAAILPSGSCFHIHSGGVGCTLQVSGDDFMSNISRDGFPVTNAVIYAGDSVTLRSIQNGGWRAAGGSASLRASMDFFALRQLNGYQRLPSGLIIQWGSVSNISTTEETTVTWPIAYPNACLSMGGVGNDTNSRFISARNPSLTTGIFSKWNHNGDRSGGSFFWMSIGH